jgi:Na+/melibiose symporter-like transporter
MIYILIGIIFMFFVEYLLNRKDIRIHILAEIGWTERIMGVILWPIFLGIFLYNFFKNLLK